MAKKKSAAPEYTSNEFRVQTDSAMAEIFKQAAARDGREDSIVSDPRSLPCLPLPSLAMRYLLKLEGFPLCRIWQLRGPRASFKSTFAVEMGRWHRQYGGYGARVETEHKPNPMLTDMVLGYKSDWFQTHEAQTVEDWQEWTTRWFVGVKKWCNRAAGPGRTVPVFAIVDSLAGTLTERTIKDIREDGHASKRFPDEAMSLTDYIKFLPQEIAGWPFTFIGVNHRKLDLSAARDGFTKFRSPGGDGVGYLMSFGLDMEKMSTRQYADRSTATIKMYLDKNSYGPEQGRIEVDLTFWSQEDEPGVWRDYCRFEWWAASIHLLNGGFFNATQADLWMNDLKAIVDIHEKPGGSLGKLFWSNALDVPSSDAMPASDLGDRLEARPDLLAAVYDVLGITRMHFFRPGVNFVAQMDEYSHLVAQADASDEARAKQQAVGEGTMVPPIKRRAPEEVET